MEGELVGFAPWEDCFLICPQIELFGGWLSDWNKYNSIFNLTLGSIQCNVWLNDTFVYVLSNLTDT